MIAAAEFCGTLGDLGYTFYTGVPCSTFKHAINHILSDPKLVFSMAANEGAALAIACGVWLAGRKPVVMLQNSGVGNLVNPLTSLCSPFGIPSLLLISGRAYPDGTGDEPQHRLMGATVRQLFEIYQVTRIDMPDEPGAIRAMLVQADTAIAQRRTVAIMVPEGRIGSGCAAPAWNRRYPLSRREAIEIIATSLPGSEVIVSTTGKISRELFFRHDRAGNFYMQGSMGHARAIALGIALSQHERQVVVLDGDGATLMHLGTLSTVGYYAPRRFLDVVLDNEAHGSTGNQYTTSATTDIAAVAVACNYAHVFRCQSRSEVQKAIRSALDSVGPSLVLIKINRIEEDLPRITDRYEQKETARLVRMFLSKGCPTAANT